MLVTPVSSGFFFSLKVAYLIYIFREHLFFWELYLGMGLLRFSSHRSHGHLVEGLCVPVSQTQLTSIVAPSLCDHFTGAAVGEGAGPLGCELSESFRRGIMGKTKQGVRGQTLVVKCILRSSFSHIGAIYKKQIIALATATSEKQQLPLVIVTQHYKRDVLMWEPLRT